MTTPATLDELFDKKIVENTARYRILDLDGHHIGENRILWIALCHAMAYEKTPLGCFIVALERHTGAIIARVHVRLSLTISNLSPAGPPPFVETSGDKKGGE